MKVLAYCFSISLLIFLAGCATPGASGPANPYQGTYRGIETLEGGSTVAAGDYPLRINISASGRIRITDIDGLTATGQLEGNRFRVVRPRPRQNFEGEIVDGTITGITTENVYTGDGTLSLKLE